MTVLSIKRVEKSIKRVEKRLKTVKEDTRLRTLRRRDTRLYTT